MKLSGGLPAVLNFALTGVVYIGLVENIAEKHETILLIPIAAYALYKGTMAAARTMQRHPTPFPDIGRLKAGRNQVDSIKRRWKRLRPARAGCLARTNRSADRKGDERQPDRTGVWHPVCGDGAVVGTNAMRINA